MTISRAERNIRWLEKHIRIPDGQYVGQPIRLADFMKDDLRAIYDNPNGTRRAIISRGRKNAKTTESAMILLLHLCGPEAKQNGQLYSAAQSREQASILFDLAAKMIRMSPVLSNFAEPKESGKIIVCPGMGTKYRALSADASTAYGLSPSLVVHDELGQVKGPRSPLYDAMETATAAQGDPLSIIISTQAPTDADLLSVLIDDAATGRDPRTVLRFQTAPESLDTFSIDAIRAANPAFDLFMNRDEVMSMAEDARNMPSRQAEFENLVLNRRVDMNSPFVSQTVWKACGGPVNSDWRGKPVYAGLDLSEAADLTALVLVAPFEADGRVIWQTKPTFWLPAENLATKARMDKVPYDEWQRDGYLQTTPGKAIEYEYIAQHLRELCSELDVRKIAFDRYNYRFLRPWLSKVGFSEADLEGDDAIFEPFGQGFASMSPALRDLEVIMLGERLAHGMHPLLTWCAANATVTMDPAGNRKLNKAKSHGRIDGMVALAMAASVAGTYQAQPTVKSFWEVLEPNQQ